MRRSPGHASSPGGFSAAPAAHPHPHTFYELHGMLGSPRGAGVSAARLLPWGSPGGASEGGPPPPLPPPGEAAPAGARALSQDRDLDPDLERASMGSRELSFCDHSEVRLEPGVPARSPHGRRLSSLCVLLQPYKSPCMWLHHILVSALQNNTHPPLLSLTAIMYPWSHLSPAGGSGTAILLRSPPGRRRGWRRVGDSSFYVGGRFPAGRGSLGVDGFLGSSRGRPERGRSHGMGCCRDWCCSE